MVLKKFLSLILLTIFTVSLINGNRQGRTLLYAEYTVLQLTMCLVEPIDGQKGIHHKRVSLNFGLSIQYNLPFNPKEFYEPILWAARSSKNFVFEDKIEKENETNETVHQFENKSDKRKDFEPRKTRDVSAGQFYDGLRQAFELMGYHEQCLLKSICELAKVPLREDDDNLLHEIINFILTPSIHQAFDNNHENKTRRIHEKAENIGQTIGLCDESYALCKFTPLEKRSITLDLI